MNNENRRERDLTKLIVAAAIALGILIGITTVAMYGPVSSYDAPVNMSDGPVTTEQP